MSRLGRDFRREKKKTSDGLLLDFPLKSSLIPTKGVGVAIFTRATTATCMCYLESAVAGNSQVLQTIPSGIPRFEGARFIASNNTWSTVLVDGTVIPEATLKGVMIEVASTNYIIQSDFLTGWASIGAGGTIVLQSDGSVLFTAGSYLYGGILRGAFYSSLAVTYSGFVDVKKANYRYVGFSFVNLDGGNTVPYYDFDTDTLNANGKSVRMSRVLLPDGFVRIYVEGFLAAGGGSYFDVAITTSLGNVAWASAGTETVYVRRYQVEQKNFSTSYIPTTTAAVTRNADVLTFPNAGNVSDTAGTVLMNVTSSFDIPNATTAGYGLNILLDFNNSVSIIALYDGKVYRSDGTTSLNSPAWIPLKNITYKIGSCWVPTGQRNWLNGTVGTNVAFDGSINYTINMTIGGSI